MKISMACDHGGYNLKEELKAWLAEKGHEIVDYGCQGRESCDYADFVEPAARAVAEGTCERGIVLCTTGIGASITANKVKGIRCALCADSLTAELTRLHNDTNMLALGAGVVGENLAERIVDVFLSTEFCGADRHARRVALINELDQER